VLVLVRIHVDVLAVGLRGDSRVTVWIHARSHHLGAIHGDALVLCVFLESILAWQVGGILCCPGVGRLVHELRLAHIVVG